eukprot:3702970-Amphidinium_carterae.4
MHNRCESLNVRCNRVRGSPIERSRIFFGVGSLVVICVACVGLHLWVCGLFFAVFGNCWTIMAYVRLYHEGSENGSCMLGRHNEDQEMVTCGDCHWNMSAYVMACC